MLISRLFFSTTFIFLALLSLNAQSSDLSRSKVLDNWAQKKLDSFTLEQKVGQLLLIGFPGKKINKGLILKMNKFNPGGLIIFGRNISTPYQVSKLLYQAQKHAANTTKIPLFFAIDQEGGVVSRIKATYRFPSAIALGKTNDVELVKRIGIGTGNILKTIGFNLNLAPVLDLGNPVKKSFIGTRAFASTAEKVANMGIAFSKGLHSVSVLPTAKHFPGHGKIEMDSHKGRPVRKLSLKKLKENDLLPFKNYSDEFEYSAIMIAHIAFPLIDKSSLPATYSPILIKSLLRDELNYKGIIITDDIEMSGAKDIKSASERAVRSIEAGVDMVMVAWSSRAQTAAYFGILNAVKKGRVSESRLNESVLRIIKHKKKMGLFGKSKKPSYTKINQIIYDKNFRDNIKRVIYKNLAQTTIEDHIKEDLKSRTPVLVFSGSYGFFKDIKKTKQIWDPRFVYISKTRSPKNVANLLDRYKCKVGVFLISGRRSANLYSRLSPEAQKKLIVINATDSSLIETENYRSSFEVGFYHPAIGEIWMDQVFNSEERTPSSNNENTISN